MLILTHTNIALINYKVVAIFLFKSARADWPQKQCDCTKFKKRAFWRHFLGPFEFFFCMDGGRGLLIPVCLWKSVIKIIRFQQIKIELKISKLTNKIACTPHSFINKDEMHIRKGNSFQYNKKENNMLQFFFFSTILIDWNDGIYNNYLAQNTIH
jgi:hypothetical protein